MNPNWCNNLDQYWLKIEHDTKQLLRKVNEDFRKSGFSFNSKFEEYFIQETNDRIASTYKRCVRKMQIEEQFGVRSDQVPAIENPINKTIAEANGEMEAVNNRPTADSTLSGVCVPGDETLQRFVSYVVKNTDPNNLTSSAEAMFGNVSMIATQIDQTRLTDVNGNHQNNDVDRNHLAQKENGMSSSVHIGELANGSMAIDQFASASMGQSNTTANGLRPVPSSTPFQSESNAPIYGSFQQITSFLDTNSDPNDVTSTINTDISLLTGDVSKIIAQNGQSLETCSKAIIANIMRQNKINMTPHDVPGLEFSVLTEIDSIAAPESEPIEAELPKDTIFGGSIDIDEEILVEEQDASSARINESFNQATECIDLTFADVESSSEWTSNQIVRQEENQRRKRKIADATTSNESSKKKRKMSQRSSTLKTIPESTSEVALVDQTLNEIESSEQANSTSSQSVQEESDGSSDNGKQSASTSKAKQVAEKKVGDGEPAAESGSLELKCDFCEHITSRKVKLKAHMRKHAEEFLFHCSICRQRFTLKEDKEAHEKSCNVRRYECYMCKKTSTSNKTNLVYHMRIHTGEKPFPCTHCSERFGGKSGLNHHLKRYHNMKRDHNKTK